jgi:hypothetical protein
MATQIKLYILSTRQQITIDVKGRTVLGRLSGVEDDGTLNIDLSPFMAFQLGVSRRHLMLIPEDDKILAFDLSSRNGSFLNGEAMSSRKGYEITDGDELRLGTLNVRVYVETEVPYLEMQTRQLPRLDKVTGSTPPSKTTGIISPLPDIRSTLSEPTVHTKLDNGGMEKVSNG